MPMKSISAVSAVFSRVVCVMLAGGLAAVPASAIQYSEVLPASAVSPAESSFLQATSESLIARGMAPERIEEVLAKGVERGLPARSIARMLFAAADLDIPGKVPAVVEVDLLPPFQITPEDAAAMAPSLEPPMIVAEIAVPDFQEMPSQDFRQGYYTTPKGKPRKHGIRNVFQDLPCIDSHWGWFPALPHLPIVTPDLPFIRTPAYSVASYFFDHLPDVPLMDLKVGIIPTPDVPYVDVDIPFVDKGGEAFGRPWPRPDIPFVKLDPPFVELNTWIFGLPVLTPDFLFGDLETPFDSLIGFIKRL
jgi:hypothetical protein